MRPDAGERGERREPRWNGSGPAREGHEGGASGREAGGRGERRDGRDARAGRGGPPPRADAKLESREGDRGLRKPIAAAGGPPMGRPAPTPAAAPPLAPAVSSPRSASLAVARAVSSSWAAVDRVSIGRTSSDDDERGHAADAGDDNPPPLVRLTPAEPAPPEAPVKYARIVGVKFRSVGLISEFDCGDKTYAQGEWVIVDGERGGRLAQVVVASTKTYSMGPLRRVIRRARPDELAGQADSSRIESEAYRFCKERLRERKLAMKLVAAEVSSGHKATFYFASEERVDFRDLVRDLAQRFHLRIEMRQIGARDGAKAVGGIGSCGRELCCTTFLPAFQPVSIRMAKDQGMVLNPSKLAGQCGRLKCCLVYEHQMYKEMGRGLPKVGKKVVTPSGPGRVLDLDILGQRVRVLLEEGGAQTFAAGEVRSLHAAGGNASGKTPEPEGLGDPSEPSDPAFSPELRSLGEPEGPPLPDRIAETAGDRGTATSAPTISEDLS